MSNPELQALLANLRPRSQASQASTSRVSGRDQLLSSPFASSAHIPSTPPPPFSPAPSLGGSAPNNALAQNLLSLLNFNQTSTQSAQPGPQPQVPADQSTRSPRTSRDISDLVARSSSERDLSFINPQTSSKPTEPNVEEEKPTEVQKEATPTPQQAAPAQATGSFTQQQDQNQNQPSTASQDGPKAMFTYKNPFEALRASRPHTPRSNNLPATPAAAQPTQDQNPVESIEDADMQEELNKIMPDRIKLTPKSRVSTNPMLVNSSSQEARDDVLPDINGHDPHTEVTEPSASQSESAQFKENPEEAAKPSDPIPVEQTAVDEGGGQPAPSEQEERVVTVMNFPVKAFVSITLQLKEPPVARVRENGVMEIARLKREFDQIDRSLAAASSKYIAYALVNKGGMRIIRQDDGKDRHIFKHTHDRIFNTSVCTTSVTSASGPRQAVLGTGISGSVYYATICKPDEDLFDTNNLDAESLIFPAYPQADENTAGGVLKTRAKRSSQHPEFFAIGRGKAIHIIWPSVVISPRYGITDTERKVNIERLLQERPLQILTGKAGKDFTFSEDDTVIVSLDKTGRLRFWDIRKLIDEENARAVQITPYVIDTPLLSLSTASPAERSWPTSVLFVDKARPYTKGGPLRYVLVGLRQNHTLQLWDIALGKAVQEINFPHESESDGICSVTYHSASGIIVVGHPTRNSLFFIHLSAPRYILSSSLSQASYIQRVAAKDPEIPKPESTACMSGIREVSFEGRGQLRSVELLPVTKPADASAPSSEEDSLFELYVAHSTGVTCLMINKKDLGWDKDNKSVHSVNAQEEGFVTINKLELGSVIEEHSRSLSPPQEQPASKSSKKKNKKAKEGAEESVNGTQEVQVASGSNEPALQIVPSAEQAPAEPTVAKESKKSKKKREAQAQAEAAAAAAASQKETARAASPQKPATSEATETSAPNHRYPLRSQAQPEQVSMGISGDWLDKEIKKIEKGVGLEFKRELMQLYENIKTDRASNDQAAASRQEAVLRVVSTTLSNNVEQTLSNIISTQMQDVLVPQVVKSLSADLSSKIVQSISQTVQQELSSVLSAEVSKALQAPQLLQHVSDDVSRRLTGQISQEITNTINITVADTMRNVAAVAASEAIASTEARLMDHIAQLQRQQTAQVETMNQVNLALQSVAQTVQAMSQAQVAFQNQVLEDRRSAQAQAQEHARSVSAQQSSAQATQAIHAAPPPQHRAASGFTASPSSSTRAIPARQRTKAELETEEVTALMEHRKYEEGSIKWLQSSQPVKLFDDLFVRFTPDYLATDVSPLVAFSIGVTVANSLSTNTEQRLQWINAALDAIDFKARQILSPFLSTSNMTQDREISELAPHAPNLVSSLIQKLDGLYIQIAKSEPESVLLAMISPLSSKARNVREMFVALATGRGLIE